MNDVVFENLLCDAAAQLREERLEKITGKQVDTICYPYGRFNNNVISKARELYEITTLVEDYHEI